MNHIEIRYTYLSAKADISINGEMISEYSELTTILKRPYLEVFPSIILELDNEIFDDYQIDFYGKFYQYQLLLNTSEKSEFCKEIRFHEIESLYNLTDILERFSIISELNHIAVEKPANITIYNSTNLSVPQSDYLDTVDSPKADIGIFLNSKEIPLTVRIPVIISDNVSYQKVGNRVYYLISQAEMPIFLDYILLEFMTRPLIEEYISALRYIKLSVSQKAELDSMKNNTENYYIGEVPVSLEKGTSFTIEFASFPADAFSLRSENNDIISCSENTITAHESGSTFITIVNNKNEVVAQKQISVIQHQYVEEIRLIPRFEYLKRNERNRIDVIITPLNAEDANRLTWNVSDPNIIQADANGSIIALENGKTTITVSGFATSATLEVEVKPTLQSLELSQQSVRLKLGETYILECNVNPCDAPTENLIWELDNKTIASINPSKTGTKCQITASTNYEGKGNVRCYDSNAKLGAICNIEVISKIKPSAAGKIALWFMIIGIIWPHLLPVSAILGIYGMKSDPERERRTRYIVCTFGSIGLLLFWLLFFIGSIQ